MIVPITVLTEVDYLLTQRARPACRGSAVWIASLAGDCHLESVSWTDLPRIVELMRQYADSNIGFVDASIVAVAERLDIRKVLTLDRRHFGPIRPRHCPALDILP